VKFECTSEIVEAAKVSDLIRFVVSDWNSLLAWFVAAYNRCCVTICPDCIFFVGTRGIERATVEEWIIVSSAGDLGACPGKLFSLLYKPKKRKL